MQTNIIYALVVMGAITAGTIGFANTLTVNAINPIGGNDGLVDIPTGTITGVSWTEIATTDGLIEIDDAQVTVENGAGIVHSYEICAVLSDGISSTSGLGCQLTGTIGAGLSLVVTVDFVPDFDTIDARNIYITLEELP